MIIEKNVDLDEMDQYWPDIELLEEEDIFNVELTPVDEKFSDIKSVEEQQVETHSTKVQAQEAEISRQEAASQTEDVNVIEKEVMFRGTVFRPKRIEFESDNGQKLMWSL